MSALALAPKYERMGARVLLAMSPFTRNLVPNDLEGVHAYFCALSEASSLPFLPYNTQSWPPEFFARLAEIEAIIGIKDPCHVPHNLFNAIKRLGDRFVWIGNKRHDPGVLHFRYQAGIEGFTAGNVNFAPTFELKLHSAAQECDWQRMVEIQERLAPLERLRLAHGDTVVKTGMDLVGLAGGRVRPPRTDLSTDRREEMKSELIELGVDLASG
jgi:5-dehydro-4-deoxyglucarate dehydratase